MIRRATLQDLPEIIKLLEYILGLHHEFRPDLYKEKGSKYSISELKEKLDCGELLIWVAEINNQVRYVDILEKSSLGGESRKCKGPEVEEWAATLKNSEIHS